MKGTSLLFAVLFGVSLASSPASSRRSADTNLGPTSESHVSGDYHFDPDRDPAIRFVSSAANTTVLGSWTSVGCR